MQQGGTVQRYDVTINGMATTLLLSDADAKAAGLTDADAADKAPAEVTTKARTPANKARKPANKRAEAVEAAFGPKADDE
jgi:hypothetical protein